MCLGRHVVLYTVHHFIQQSHVNHFQNTLYMSCTHVLYIHTYIHIHVHVCIQMCTQTHYTCTCTLGVWGKLASLFNPPPQFSRLGIRVYFTAWFAWFGFLSFSLLVACSLVSVLYTCTSMYVHIPTFDTHVYTCIYTLQALTCTCYTHLHYNAHDSPAVIGPVVGERLVQLDSCLRMAERERKLRADNSVKMFM